MQPLAKLLCTKEVADRLGVTPRIVAKLFRKNEIRSFKLSGKYWRTTELYLELYVSRKVHERMSTLAIQRSVLSIKRPTLAA